MNKSPVSKLEIAKQAWLAKADYMVEIETEITLAEIQQLANEIFVGPKFVPLVI